MLEGVNFVYDGVKSVDMGVFNCNVDGGMFEETFLSTREIRETSVSGNSKPYFYDVVDYPMEFNLTFAFEDSYDERSIRSIARWLKKDYYKPFYTTDNPNRIFYCMVKGDSMLVHNGLKQGYISLTMRCDSPYSYTPFTLNENYEIEDGKGFKVVKESGYTSQMGTQSNVKISSGNLAINNASPVWSDFSNMSWSDLA